MCQDLQEGHLLRRCTETNSEIQVTLQVCSWLNYMLFFKTTSWTKRKCFFLCFRGFSGFLLHSRLSVPHPYILSLTQPFSCPLTYETGRFISDSALVWTVHIYTSSGSRKRDVSPLPFSSLAFSDLLPPPPAAIPPAAG